MKVSADTLCCSRENFWLIDAAATTVIWPYHVGIIFSHWVNVKLALRFVMRRYLPLTSLLPSKYRWRYCAWVPTIIARKVKVESPPKKWNWKAGIWRNSRATSDVRSSGSSRWRPGLDNYRPAGGALQHGCPLLSINAEEPMAMHSPPSPLVTAGDWYW